MYMQNQSVPIQSGQMMGDTASPAQDWSGEISGSPAGAGAPRPNVIPYRDQAAMQEAGVSRNGTVSPSGERPMGNGNLTVPAATGDLSMKHNLPASMIGAPQTATEAYLGSLKAMLSRNVGNYIVATFLVGTQNMVTWEGVLYDVGNDYLTIYQEGRDRYVVSDYYSLKFVTFYDTRRRSMCNQLLQEQDYGMNSND